MGPQKKKKSLTLDPSPSQSKQKDTEEPASFDLFRSAPHFHLPFSRAVGSSSSLDELYSSPSTIVEHCIVTSITTSRSCCAIRPSGQPKQSASQSQPPTINQSRRLLLFPALIDTSLGRLGTPEKLVFGLLQPLLFSPFFFLLSLLGMLIAEC